MHILDSEPLDHQRSGTVRRAHHRDAGVPAGEDDPSCLPKLSLPGGVCGKAGPAGQHRRARPLLPIRARRYHHHRLGGCKHAGPPEGWVRVYDDRVGSVKQPTNGQWVIGGCPSIARARPKMKRRRQRRWLISLRTMHNDRQPLRHLRHRRLGKRPMRRRPMALSLLCNLGERLLYWEGMLSALRRERS
jgi:hypothetical protein